MTLAFIKLIKTEQQKKTTNLENLYLFLYSPHVLYRCILNSCSHLFLLKTWLSVKKEMDFIDLYLKAHSLSEYGQFAHSENC